LYVEKGPDITIAGKEIRDNKHSTKNIEETLNKVVGKCDTISHQLDIFGTEMSSKISCASCDQNGASPPTSTDSSLLVGGEAPFWSLVAQDISLDCTESTLHNIELNLAVITLLSLPCICKTFLDLHLTLKVFKNPMNFPKFVIELG
jgi:hypothetical protein